MFILKTILFKHQIFVVCLLNLFLFLLFVYFQRKKLETKLDKELEETQATESKKKIQQNVRFLFHFHCSCML